MGLHKEFLLMTHFFWIYCQKFIAFSKDNCEWFYNVFGTIKILFILGKPEAVQNCSVTNESTDSFQVTCQPGFNGGLPQHFTLTVYKVAPQSGELDLSANLSSALPAFTVSGLDPGSKYVGELVGHNVKGMGVPTQIHVYTLKLPEKLIPHLEDGHTSAGKKKYNLVVTRYQIHSFPIFH